MAVIEVNTLVQNFNEKLMLSLREEGVKESKILGFDTASRSNYSSDVFVGFGIKDGYIIHSRKGMELFDSALAAALSERVSSISTKHLYENAPIIKAIAEKHGQYGVVITSANGLLLKPSFVSLVEREKLPELLSDENLLKYAKDLYVKLAPAIDETLAKFGKNPEAYKQDFQSREDIAKAQDLQKFLSKKRDELVLDNVIEIFKNSDSLKPFLENVEVNYDVAGFSRTEIRNDNGAKISFTPKNESINVDLKSDRKIAEQMLATIYQYLGDNKQLLTNDGNAEALQNQLAYQFHNRLLHNNDSNLMFFKDSKTLRISKDLLVEVEQIQSKLEKPLSTMEQVLNNVKAAFDKDMSNQKGQG